MNIGKIKLVKLNRGHIILPQFGWGFFSNYFRVLTHIKASISQELEPWVDLRNTAFVYNPYTDLVPVDPPNPWDWWFDQSSLGDSNLIDVYCNYNEFDHSSRLWGRPDIPILREIANKHIKIKGYILDQIDKIFNCEFKNKTILGVMARGCEMNHGHPEFGNQTIETWILKIKEVLNEKKIDRIFIVTEDSHYLPIFEQNFDNIFYLDVFRRTDETLEYVNQNILWAILNTKRENHCRLLGEECLIQALLLGKCDYLIGKQCGTTNAAIFYSENLKDVYYT